MQEAFQSRMGPWAELGRPGSLEELMELIRKEKKKNRGGLGKGELDKPGGGR
jgi:hypothetical protein